MATFSTRASSFVSAAALGLAACLPCAAANYCTWTGGGDGVSWGDTNNWSNLPAAGSDSYIARFTGSADVVLDSKWKDVNGNARDLSGLSVEGGNVSISAGDLTTMQMRNAPIVQIAAGSTLVTSNITFSYYHFNWFKKQGEGTWRLADCYFSGQHVWQLDVTAGVMEAVKSSSCTINTTNLVVRSGAELSLDKAALSTTANLTLETNAVLRVNGGTTTIASLQGEGDIISGPESSTLQINLTHTFSRPFYGSFSTNINLLVPSPAAGVGYFVVQKADQLADVNLRQGLGLRFREGLDVCDVGCLDGYNSGTIVLADENGGAVSVRADIDLSGYLHFQGPGNLHVKNSATLYQNLYAATGTIVACSGASVTLGEGSNAQWDFDLSGNGVSGLYCEEGGSLTIKNYTKCLTADVPVVSFGAASLGLSSANGLVMKDLRFTATNAVNASYGINLAGGELVVSKMIGNGGSAISSRSRIFSGAKVYAPKTVASADTRRTLPQPNGVDITGDTGWFTTIITDGELYRSYSGGGHKNHYMLGGRTYFPHNSTFSTTVSALSDGGNAKVVFDGGTAVLYNREDTTTFSFPCNSSSIDLFVSTNGGRIVVSPPSDNLRRVYNIPIPITATNGVNAPFILDGNGTFTFSHPMQLAGPVHLMDGEIRIGSHLFTDGVAAPFGTGSLLLRNSVLFPYGLSESATLELAKGDGASLTFKGAPTIASRSSASATPAAIIANSLSRAGKGSVLFYQLYGDEVPGEGPTMKFSSALDLQSNGITRLPIVIRRDLVNGFATYDATDGLLDFGAYVTNDYTQGAGSIVYQTRNTTISSDAAVGGLVVRQSWTSLSIAGGATLTVGNGVDPAFVMLGVVCHLSGAGTVDFGSSEGIFLSDNTTGATPNTIAAKISGSGGVSFAGSALNDHDYRFVVKNSANDYTGGTYVNAATVRAGAPGCFSSGQVNVGGGVKAGGQVLFTSAGTWDNDFAVSGHGSGAADKDAQYAGAVAFAADATLSGDVSIEEEVRMSAKDGVTGTLSGVVSGGRLQVYDHPETYGGTIALTGHNTYTGGTEVVGAAIAVAESDGLGTGDVTIDDSTIEFLNTSPIVVTNRIEGCGLVRMTGGGAVALSCDLNDFSAPLDLAGCDLTLESMPDFVTGITNTVSSRCTLTVSDDATLDFTGYNVGGLEKVDLVVGDGASVDLGGATVTVRRLIGKRTSVVNGTLVQLHPTRGFTLTLK